jgi:LysM repeat protein
MPYYTVKEGDHLSGIAERFGFPDYRKIWNDPENAALKQLDRNPNVLFPGDVIFIPELEAGERSGETDKRHSYVVRKQPLQLRIQLEKMYDSPIADTPCDLKIGLDVFPLTSSSQGLVENTVSKYATEAGLTIHDSVAVRGQELVLDI